MGKDTDLLEAARVGNAIIIERLLSTKQKNVLSQALSFRRSVSPNCQDGSGYTPLHHAVLNGHRDIVELLLKYEASPIVPDNRGNTPLHLAAWTGNSAMLNALLMKGITRGQVNEQNNDGDSHLHFASQYGHTEVVEILLEKGANPDVLNKKDESPLDLASQYGRLDVVEVLLRKQPSLLEKIPEGRSLLHLAARNGHHLIIRKLLEFGCDINKKLPTGTALHEAALFGKVEVVRALLESLPQIDVYAKDGKGETAVQKVQGHSSKMARDITALIKAFARGEPLPPTSSPVVSLSQSSSDGDDVEPPSIYDNLPLKGNHSTLPLVSRKTREQNLSYEPVQFNPERSGPALSSGIRENYVNIKLGEKSRTPPKKPARVSIGHLLEQLNENGLTENSSEGAFANSASMFDLRDAPQQPEPPVGKDDSPSHLSLPPNYEDQEADSDVDHGDYAMLRPDAFLIKETTTERIPAAAGITTNTEAEVEAADVKSCSSHDSQSTGADPDSLHEESAQSAATGQDKRPVGKTRRKLSAPIASMDSDPEGDIEVYELLADAVTGDDKESGSSRASSRRHLASNSDVALKPVPAPRRNISPCVTPMSPKYFPAVAPNGSPPTEGFSPYRKEDDPTETPSHPPPSPHTAMLGIQARFSQHKLPAVDAGDEDDDQVCSCDELPGDCNSISPSTIAPTHQQHPYAPPNQQFVFQSIAEESAISSSSSGDSKSQLLKTELPIGTCSEQKPNSSINNNLKTGIEGFKPIPPKRINVPCKMLSSDVKNVDHASSTNGIGHPRDEASSIEEDVVTALTVEQVERFNGIPSSPTKIAVKAEDARTNSSSSESDVLRPDEADPFAGLVRGSNQRSRVANMQERPLKAEERNMGTDCKDSNGFTEENSGGVGGGGGGLDESSEWAQIESIMASFGAGLVRESVYVRDYEMNFQKMLEGSEKPQTVADWLDGLGIGQYLYTLIANGFDNLNFLGNGIMEDQDLKEIGIQDECHRKLLLEATKLLPKMKSIGEGGDHVPIPSSITEWLRSLVLSDYIQNFTEKGKTTMEKVRGLWDVEMENVLEIHMLGHRKRILASLGDWRQSIHSLHSSGSTSAIHDLASPSSPSMTSRSALDLTLDLDTKRRGEGLVRANSSSLDIDLFKDYSKDVTSPLRSRPTAMTGTNGKAWTLPERGRRHHMNRSTLSSNHGKSYAHSQESLPEDFNVYERTKSDALTIPQSRKKTHEMGTQVTPGIDENIPDIIKTDDKKKMKKSGLRRQNSANISTQTTDELSDSSSLDVIANTKPQWMHRPEDLVKGCCNYTASYLGSTIVKDLQGTDSTRSSCVRLRRSAHHVQKVPTITLSISYAGVKFIDTKSKMIIAEHEICNISCVSQYEEDMGTFAYITRDETYDRIYCHVFTVKTVDLASEIILTLGQAFELAYQLLVKTHPSQQVPQLSSPDSEDTKL
ncbi:ankyrin repeat and sterile alpha motif domain-containing protein 1B-like isoform X2 [Apostichopus japonicus]|uniref:ankyrin repeat and sterile alpha motif domain-containing protein 1B-like isoform X2 n=1 Tax=Stichopus japonicus TaxID=307972 RepID=UPI003AB5122D